MNIISDKATIAPGVQLGAFCIVGDDVVLKPGVTVGDYCKIESGTVLEEGVSLQGYNRVGKRCRLGKGVSMKMQAILTSDATVGAETFLGVSCVTLGSDTDGEQKPITIGANCYIGGKAMISAGINIPDGTIIGAGAFVRSIDGKGTYVGLPARKL